MKTSNSCAWTATSTVPWVVITAGAQGIGNGSVTYTVAPNTGVSSRTGTLAVAGQTFTITEDPAPPPPPCSYSISPNSQTVAGAGGQATVSVSTTSVCAWTASSNASWITITSGASGVGSGSVAFTVDPNPGGSRTGTLTIAGRTATVKQDAVEKSVSGVVSSLGGTSPPLQ